MENIPKFSNQNDIKNIIKDIREKHNNIEKELENKLNKMAGTVQSQLTSQFQVLINQFADLNQTLAKVDDKVMQSVNALQLGPNTTRAQSAVKKTLDKSFKDIQNSIVKIQQDFIQKFYNNFNQIIRVNLADFSNTIQSLIKDIMDQVEKI